MQVRMWLADRKRRERPDGPIACAASPMRRPPPCGYAIGSTEMLVRPPRRPAMKSLTTWSSPISSTIETGYSADGGNDRRKKARARSGVSMAAIASAGA